MKYRKKPQQMIAAVTEMKEMPGRCIDCELYKKYQCMAMHTSIFCPYVKPVTCPLISVPEKRCLYDTWQTRMQCSECDYHGADGCVLGYKGDRT